MHSERLGPHRWVARHDRWFTLAAIAVSAAVGLTPAAAPAQGEPPLAPFAAQKLSVMPVQFLRADSGAPVRAADWTTLRREIDDSIGTVIAERGVGKKWAYAADVVRLARRNVGYVSDPYTLGAGALRNRVLKRDEQASRTLLDNLRSLIALGDSRYALLPVDLSFARQGPAWMAVLRLVLLDGRAGQVTWFTDVVVDAGATFDSAAAGRLAQGVADLVIAR